VKTNDELGEESDLRHIVTDTAQRGKAAVPSRADPR